MEFIKRKLILSNGDSNEIKCWQNSYVLGVGPLVKQISSHANLASECTSKDMVTESRVWTLDLFRLWILKIIIHRIVSIPPPYSTAGPVKIVWMGTSSGSFSIKSAY